MYDFRNCRMDPRSMMFHRLATEQIQEERGVVRIRTERRMQLLDLVGGRANTSNQRD